MTDITDEQRIAYAQVEEACGIPVFEDAWAEVRKLLPSDLTNPQPPNLTERPQITREQIRATVGPLLTNVMNYPQEISARMLGLDFSGIIVKMTDAIDELVNGTDQ